MNYVRSLNEEPFVGFAGFGLLIICLMVAWLGDYGVKLVKRAIRHFRH